MKLQKQLNRETKTKKYTRYLVILSSEVIKELGWRKGTNLVESVKNKKLILIKGGKKR